MKNIKKAGIVSAFLISQFFFCQSVKSYKNEDFHFKVHSNTAFEVYPGEDGGTMKSFSVHFGESQNYDITLTAYYFSNKEFSEAVKKTLLKRNPELITKVTENKDKSLVMLVYSGKKLIKAYKFFKHDAFCFLLSIEEESMAENYQKYFTTFSFF